MKIDFHEIAWDDYLEWQKTNQAVLRKIHQLIKDIQRNRLEVSVNRNH